MRIAESEKIKKTFAFNVDIFTVITKYKKLLLIYEKNYMIVYMELRRLKGGHTFA